MDNKKYKQEYYQRNKEKMDNYHKKWCEENKERKNEIVSKSKRKRVDKLRKKGVTNAWNVVNYGVQAKYNDEIFYRL